MSGAITAVGVGIVGTAIMNNQAQQAAKGAANAQKDALNAATDVERERLQMEYQQYQEQMQEYQRKQAMSEKQMQQQMVNLAPYMQAGQGALYEMMALSGMAAPAGSSMPTTVSAPMAGLGAADQPAYQQPGTGLGSTIGKIGGGLAPIQSTGAMSPAAQEFSKGGLSLSSNKWQTVGADATSPRAQAAHMLAQVRSEMPNATVGQQQQEAIDRLNAQFTESNRLGQQQATIEDARASVPDITAATSPYAGMTGEEAQAAALQKISQSPLMQELMSQGETGILQNAAATGGLRGGRVQGVLAQYRPQMLQNEIDKLYSRYQGLSGLGQQSILGSPTTQVGSMPTYSGQSQIPSLLTQAGSAQAGGILSSAQNQQNLFQNIGQIAGWGLGQYRQGGFFGNGNTSTPATSTTMVV